MFTHKILIFDIFTIDIEAPERKDPHLKKAYLDALTFCDISASRKKANKYFSLNFIWLLDPSRDVYAGKF